MRGGGTTRKLKTRSRKPYMVRLSNKYQIKLERSHGDAYGSGIRFDSCCLGTSFKNKLDQVQHE